MIVVIKHNKRVLLLHKYLGGDRWLCTDREGKCHPCYYGQEMTIIAN